MNNNHGRKYKTSRDADVKNLNNANLKFLRRKNKNWGGGEILEKNQYIYITYVKIEGILYHIQIMKDMDKSRYDRMSNMIHFIFNRETRLDKNQ